MKWRVTYRKEEEDKRKSYTEDIEASNYTKAYFKFIFEHPKTHIIINLVAISA